MQQQADLELSQILDALEAGLLHLGRERDELRRRLSQDPPEPKTKPATKKAPAKAAKKAAPKAVKKAAPKAFKKAAAKAVKNTAKKSTPKKLAAAAPPSEPKPKAPAKSPAKPRQALGKSLLQLRARPVAPTATAPQSD